MRRYIIFFAVLLALAVSAAEVRPKYLFLLIGDGMGQNSVKLYRDQMKSTSFDRLGTPVLTGTDNVFGKTTDSAASGTALACGIKTQNGSLGMDKDGVPVTSLAKILRDRGVKIGIISSVSITDATPAAHYANRKHRRDYAGVLSDFYVSGFDFFGVSHFSTPKEMPEKDLMFQLKRNKFTVYKNKPLSVLKKGDKNCFIAHHGIYGSSKGYTRPQAALADVTAKAIELLDNPNGFFMMVEGGAIDHFNHRNEAGSMIREFAEFDKAISVVLDFAAKHPQETLVVVTADHETGGLMIDGKVPADFWKKQLIHYNAIEIQLKKMLQAKSPKSELIAYVCKNLSLENLTDSEMESLNKAADRFMAGKKTEKGSMYGKYNSLLIAAFKVSDARNNIRYTTFSHTNAKVFTFASGNGAELFKEPLENSDIPRRISIAATGVDLLEKNKGVLPFPNVPAKPHFTIQSVSDSSIICRYNLPGNKGMKFTLTDGKDTVSKEASGEFARIVFDGLKPATEYILKVAGVSGKAREIKVRTQAKLENVMLRGAIIADPHTSTTPDNPRMRLHSRSGELLAAAVESLNKKKIDVLLVPGDVTDRSRSEEFKLFGKTVAKAKYPVITVPGNHDRVTEDNLKHYNRVFKSPASYREINGIQIVSLNTWDGKLNKPENAEVLAKLDVSRPAIIQCHHQLVQSNDVIKNDKHARISDSGHPEVKKMLEKIANSRSVVFVGHKNLAERALIGGKVTQINCPQLTQYPNGYLMFEANAKGVAVSYVPSSCVYIEEFSRRLAPSYSREKNALKCWNTFIPWGGK